MIDKSGMGNASNLQDFTAVVCDFAPFYLYLLGA